ncbi:MAG: penicillin-binding protein [bacterium]
MKIKFLRGIFGKKIKRSNQFKTKFKHKLLKGKKRNWKILIPIALYGILSLFLITGVLFVWYAKDLPTPSKIAAMKPAESTKFYDRTGTILLYETGQERRTIVASDQISTYLKDATISTEDANFYSHHGFDPKAIITALAEKVIGKTKVARGGSTITQQYVKLALLTSDRSLSRKIKELILSIELEFMFSKDQILTMYLNQIPYGNGTAGAEAAAQMYYGKSAKDLDLAQAATLAGIPQSPTYYSPYGTHIDRLISRKDYVLDRMVETGKITKEIALEAKAEDSTTIGAVVKAKKDAFLTPHFAMYVQEQIVAEYGEEVIQKQGLKIITTLDYDKQIAAQASINDNDKKLAQYNASNAALVATDPKNGQILAMVGSKDYFNTDIDGNVNITDSLRQPGSSFKPFAYATAFKQPEYSPSKIIFDLQTDFGNYTPNNYNMRFNGPVTIRQALSNSLNIPAVKIMSLAGIDNVLQTASDMGISTLNDRERYGLSLVLGAGEVKPVEMANAFSVFANSGNKNELTSILKITNNQNKVIYEYKPEDHPAKTALDPQIAYEISNILSDNNSRSLVFGTRSSLYFPDRTVAVKTGTTSDFKDAWTVGFTPSISVAVWVGNSDATKMKSGADGSVLAGPIFHTFINKALVNTPNEDFVRPAGIQDVTVEKYSNKLPNENSLETTTDIFADWQSPKDKDNVHVAVKICKGSNLLAPADMPENLTETKIFTKVQSERPTNPSWENPVRAWAEGNGMYNSAPTETCDSKSFIPTVSIISPVNNATVSDEYTISTSSSSTYEISGVEFFIDNISIGDVTSAPYTKNYNFGNLANGEHKISVILTDSNGTIAKNEISITTVASSGPTISKIDIKVAPESTATNKIVTISWQTDVPATGQISAKSADGTVAKDSDINNTLDTNHSATINLPIATQYTFILHSKDSKGHETTANRTIDIP